MSFNVNRVFETTAFRNVVRGAAASLVGALVAWGTTKWASLNNSSLSYLVPTFTTGYFAAVHFLEKKYPKLGWLLGVLPQKPTVLIVPPVVPAPAPAPAEVKVAAKTAGETVAKKAVAKKAPAAKKAAPKKNDK